MANNKTGKDASGSTFTYKTTDTAGVDTPHINIDVVATTATSLGKAEDAAHTTGDTGVMMLAVRNDAGTALAADGDYIPVMVDSAGRLYVNVAAGTLSLTGEDHIGQVGGHTPIVRPTVTLSTTPDYSIGDIMGGEISLTNLVRTSGGTGVLGSIVLTDVTNTKPELDLVFFESNPAGTYTDNAAFPSGLPDDAITLGFVTVATTDWKTFGNGAMAVVPPAKLGSYANASQTPYMVIVTRTAYNAAATDDLRVGVFNLQD